MANKIAFLRVTSWKETLGYAQHYYGCIDLNDRVSRDIDVRKKLTEAKAMWKADKRRGEAKPLWKEGDSCGAFLEKQTLCESAKKLLPKGFSALVVGQPYIMEPQPVIWAKKKFTRHKNQINRLYQLAEANDGWEGDGKAMKKICEEWEKLFEEMNKDE